MLPLHVCFSTHLRTPNTSLFPYTTLFRSHAGRPPAHHGVVLHGGGGNELSALLHRRLGVHRALDRLQDVDLAHTAIAVDTRSEEHTSELQSRGHLVCRPQLENQNGNLTPD